MRCIRKLGPCFGSSRRVVRFPRIVRGIDLMGMIRETLGVSAIVVGDWDLRKVSG